VYVYFLQHYLSPLMSFSERSSASAPGLQRRFAAACRKLKPRESSAMITWRWPFPCHGKRSITRCRRLKHIRLLSESRAVNRCRACSMLWDPKSRRRLRRHLVFGRAQPTGANAPATGGIIDADRQGYRSGTIRKLRNVPQLRPEISIQEQERTSLCAMT
jgi:hypothetical protein